jgi:hypothetical protein
VRTSMVKGVVASCPYRMGRRVFNSGRVVPISSSPQPDRKDISVVDARHSARDRLRYDMPFPQAQKGIEATQRFGNLGAREKNRGGRYKQ